MKVLSLSTLAVVLASLLAPSLRAETEFSPVPVELRDRAAVMKLPDGVRRVRLRIRNEDGTLTTSTIAHLEGSEGYLKLRLPDGVMEKDLEVSASWTDPFPYSFYQGTKDHAGTETDGGFAVGPFFGPQAMEDNNSENPDAEPVVEESDIWKWRGSTLYFFNQYRGLQVIDVSDPAAPDRLASLRVDAYGEQMYLHPQQDVVILLTQDASTGNGAVLLVAHEAAHVLQQRHRLPIPGYIIESRLVGNILYVVSQNYWQESTTAADGVVHIQWRSGLAVTKIDLNDPANPLAGPPLRLGDGPYSYWGAQVQATAHALLVSTNAYDSSRRQSLSTLHVIDISDPAAPPAVTHHLPVAGQILNKFNLNLSGDNLTVVSQVWRGATTRQRYASVETFNLSRNNPRLAGIEFSNNESITATRFVGDLLYVVTFLRIDPLFVIDLSDPSRPKLRSELEIPGFSTYLQPLGDDALISIGVEGSQIAVSWFDVSNPAAPSLASRVYIGAKDGWSWTEANWDEKAFGFFPDDGFLLIPYQGSVPGQGWISGVQLVELGDRELTTRGSFEHEFQARRARLLGEVVVSISGRSLKSLDISDPDHPRLLGELTLAWPAELVHRVGDFLVQLERGPSYFFSGTPDSPARLHVSPANDPDELLTSLDLPGGRIVGSFLHGACLFLAQLQTTQVETGGDVESAEVFTTTVLDLTDPARPILTGQAFRETANPSTRYGFGSDYVGALLPDGALVWYPAEQQTYYAWDIVPLRPMVAIEGDAFFPYYPTTARVFTVDIADKTQPAVLAAVDLTTPEQTWPEGEIRLVGSTLYHGLQHTETTSRPDGSVKWFSHHLLGALDLSDPAAPVAGEPVKFPGAFQHALRTSSGGTLLFTTSQSSFQDAAGTWRNELRVQALAFDGMDAFLIDELVVPDYGYGPQLFDERFVVLGKTDYTDGAVTTALTIYEWSNAGAFRKVQTLQQPFSIYDLVVIDHLLVTRSAELSFIDFADPADPEPASVSYPATRFWQGLDKIDIHQRAEAHLPLGFYGVQTLDFGGIFDGSTPAAPPSPGQPPSTEWVVVPLKSLPLTSATAGSLLAPLAAEQNWTYAGTVEQLSYEAWMRSRLALAATDPVPPSADDTDGDGENNYWEFLTGTDPSDPTAVAHLQLYLATLANGETRLHAYLPLNPHAAASLRVTAEHSLDLEHWDRDPARWSRLTDSFLPGALIQWGESIKTTPRVLLRLELAPEAALAP